MIKDFSPGVLKQLYTPDTTSHKGQNGKLLLIGGSKLFHAASLWALNIASRIVDMVYYSSIPENNQIVLDAKKEFSNGIVVPRIDIESYIDESDCILIGPGMVRTEKRIQPTEEYSLKTLQELDEIEHEGIQTYYLTQYLLQKYPTKKWVIDAGALQMMEADWLKKLQQPAIVTPHEKEFLTLFGKESSDETVSQMAKDYTCIILMKGSIDLVCSSVECVRVPGGNAGMTKGGTGDVLAGLVAALACKNDPFLAALTGSFINKKSGEALYEKVGLYFNASDLVDEIPKVMKKYLL